MVLEPGVEEARVEAVAGADGVDRIDENGGDPIALNAGGCSLLDERAARTALYDDEGNAGCQSIERFVEGGLAGHLLEFLFVGEEHVDFFEEGGEDAAPVAGGIVVGVEAEGEAGLFEVVEKLGETGVEGSLEEERGEMKVAG